MNQKSGWTQAYAAWIVRWRWSVIILSILLALSAASGGRFLGFNTDYRVFFSDDNPQLIAFEALQETYTKIDNIQFVIESLEGDVITPEVLGAVEEITQQAWLLPYALRVDSVSNFQHTTAVEDDLMVARLVEDASQLTAEQLHHIRNVAQHEPSLKTMMISANNKVTAVNVTFQMPEKEMDEVPTAAAAARQLAMDIEAKYPVKIYLNGMVMMNNAFIESSMNDMGSLVPMMYLIILIMMLVLVRSIAATFATLLIIAFSVMTGMGLAGWSGILLTPPSSAATTIIMTLAVADSIHLIVSMLANMRKGMEKRLAIIEALRINFMPIFLTSITTAIGFLSMNASDSPPFHDLGNITAMGVMAAFIFSVSLLPALLAVLPVKARVGESRLATSMHDFANWIISHQRLVMVGSVVVAVMVLAMIPRNELNEDFVKYFDTSTSFRADADFAAKNLTGIYQLQYSLPAAESNGVSDPAFLTQTKAFVDWLRTQPEVQHVNSITDTFQRLNMSLHGDDPAYYTLPESRELGAQYLLLYELSLPYGLDMNNQLNVDKSSTQIIATLENMTSRELREVTIRGEEWLKTNAPALQATGIGPGIMFAYISERNIKSMLGGTFIALLLISVLITIALRSIKIGLISLLPNLLPAGLAFGVWGLLVGEVNMAAAMVTGMSLGIVVDDSIHFLSKYLRARREQGLDAEAAVRYAFSSVGVAIVVTSVVLVAGFMVLAQSTFALNSDMALLTSIAIAMALLADFFLLPVLLMRLDKSKTTSDTAQNTTESRSIT
ncbi:MAG: MMPL family transporter [Mariprofundaceae bacterium]|nr:MMPL family transporter [Mariprofundaceae bacterium]